MPLFGTIPANQNVEVDPVWVQPGAPASPDSGELWWDTDEPVPPYSGQELAYNAITANIPISNTAAATAALVIEGTSRSYDGSPIMVEFYCPIAQAPPVINNGIYLALWDQGTDLGIIGEVYNNAATYGLAATVYGRRRIVPTVGTHNYRMAGYVTSSSGTVFAGGGGPGVFSPAFIRVTRV